MKIIIKDRERDIEELKKTYENDFIKIILKIRVI